MRKGLSTGKPTKAEAQRIEDCKNGPCMACVKLYGIGSWWIISHCDYHHLKSGNIRRGHRYGIGLCGWHHRRIPENGYTIERMTAIWGPSLMDGSRKFHETYGSDDELLALQDELIGWTDA